MIPTVSESIVGGEPGRRVWRCGLCGRCSRWRRTWRQVTYGRAFHDRCSQPSAAIVCSDDCLAALRRHLGNRGRVETPRLSDRDEIALRLFADSPHPIVRASRSPAVLTRKGLLRHVGGSEYRWTRAGIAAARTLLGRPSTWVPAHRSFTFQLDFRTKTPHRS